jgi:hypothetical protein
MRAVQDECRMITRYIQRNLPGQFHAEQKFNVQIKCNEGACAKDHKVQNLRDVYNRASINKYSNTHDRTCRIVDILPKCLLAFLGYLFRNHGRMQGITLVRGHPSRTVLIEAYKQLGSLCKTQHTRKCTVASP